MGKGDLEGKSIDEWTRTQGAPCNERTTYFTLGKHDPTAIFMKPGQIHLRARGDVATVEVVGILGRDIVVTEFAIPREILLELIEFTKPDEEIEADVSEREKIEIAIRTFQGRFSLKDVAAKAEVTRANTNVHLNLLINRKIIRRVRQGVYEMLEVVNANQNHG